MNQQIGRKKEISSKSKPTLPDTPLSPCFSITHIQFEKEYEKEYENKDSPSKNLKSNKSGKVYRIVCP